LHSLSRMRLHSRATLGALALVLGVSNAATAATVIPPPPVAACSPAPLPCTPARKIKLQLDFVHHRLSWKWSARNVVSFGQLSNPTLNRAGYDLCVYDASGALFMATGVPPGGVCSGRPCWRAKPWGYEYRSATGQSLGLTKIMLKVGHRADKLLVTGAGNSLPMPPTPPASSVTVQLVRSDDHTACWTSTAP